MNKRLLGRFAQKFQTAISGPVRDLQTLFAPLQHVLCDERSVVEATAGQKAVDVHGTRVRLRMNQGLLEARQEACAIGSAPHRSLLQPRHGAATFFAFLSGRDVQGIISRPQTRPRRANTGASEKG